MSPTLGRSAVLGVLVLLLLGCGGGDRDELVVSAATSLKRPLTEYGRAFEGAAVRLSFAGSDELAAQIRQGVRPDVFAAANTELPQQLHEEGLLERPAIFATNQLIVAVPMDSPIDAVGDLARDGVDVAVGAQGVPVGAYTREALDGLRPAIKKGILRNVRSEEPDVAGIVGKLTQGAADAGFVYATDILTAGGRLRPIDLPHDLDPDVEYGIAVVRDAPNPEQARRFVDGLLHGRGAQVLEDAGFGGAP